MWTWLAIGSTALATFWLAEVAFMWVTLRAERRADPLALEESDFPNLGGSGS